jgi:predicted GNAT family acetyltransferase
MDLQIEHLVDQGRFQTIVNGQPCIADYRLAGSVMSIVHTEVTPSAQGRGIAAELMRAVLDYAREAGLKVRPLCSYARVYMQRHPETASLLA